MRPHRRPTRGPNGSIPSIRVEASQPATPRWRHSAPGTGHCRRQPGKDGEERGGDHFLVHRETSLVGAGRAQRRAPSLGHWHNSGPVSSAPLPPVVRRVRTVLDPGGQSGPRSVHAASANLPCPASRFAALPEIPMPGLLPDVDPDGLLEYSVVYTDRALNHMSRKFQGVMRDISAMLKEAYGARSAIVVPGSGTFGMEAVARQFATDRHCLVIRNGWFSYRWTQIFEMGRIPASCTVLKARRARPGAQEPFAPPPIDEVVADDPRREAGGRVRAARRDRRRHDPARRLPARAWPTPCTRWAACSCSTASPRARCGSTWRRPASTCWSAPRRRAGAARPAAPS